MRASRAVLLALPPLAAELVGRVLATRLQVVVVAIIAQADDALPRLLELAPDAVVIGETGRTSLATRELLQSALPRARILFVSADLRWLYGPGADDAVPLTTASLAERLGGDWV